MYSGNHEVNTMGWKEEDLILKILGQMKLEQLKLEKDSVALDKKLTTLSNNQSDCCQKINNKLDQFNNKLDQLETKLDQLINKLIPPEPGPPASFTATITVDEVSTEVSDVLQGEITMAKAKKVGATLSNTINDDGSRNVNVQLQDADGLQITSLTVWPAALAQPVAAAADATPGPSAFAFAAVTPPTANPDGSFLVATVTCVQPVVQPPAQNVDVTVSIASGLVNQTAPVSADAGTLSIVADANAPGGFTTAIV